MNVVTDRATFESLIDLRLREAELLLDQGLWDGAYYLAGYAVEFALKVKVIQQMKSWDHFPEKRTVEKFYKHELAQLLELADLVDEMDRDPVVSPHWDVVTEWSEQARYQQQKSEQQSRDLYNAIALQVLPWIKSRW